MCKGVRMTSQQDLGNTQNAQTERLVGLRPIDGASAIGNVNDWRRGKH